MKIVDEQEYLTIGEVSKIVGRSVSTIRNWYEYAEQIKVENKLPPLFRELDKKGTRYIKKEDVAKLEKFKNSIRYGSMATFNATKWGERGK